MLLFLFLARGPGLTQRCCKCAAGALTAGLVPGTSPLRPWPGGKELLKTLLAQEQIGHQEIEAGKEKAARSGPGEQQRRLEGLSRDETATSPAAAEPAPEPARNEIIQKVPARWELLRRDAREGHQPGRRHFRLNLTPCSERLCGVRSPGQRRVGCPYPKKLRGANELSFTSEPL